MLWYTCVLCGAPFRHGMPHKLCLERRGRMAKNPTYWKGRPV